MEVRELEKKFEKGLKIDYTKIRNAITKCEVERQEKNSINECKKNLRDLGIEVFD